MTNESAIGADVVAEPLAESAPIQLQLAERFCTDDCRWYHGPRLYLRALGITRGIQPDTCFMLDAIGRVARGAGHARVLISGSADYSMLAHAVTAFRAAGRPVSVTVADICLTPLRMNAWYGARVDVPVQLHHGDVFGLQPDEAFDLICTHAFFGRFDAEGRRRLAAKWRTLLKPGGTIVTAYRSRRSTARGEASLADVQKLRIRERARRALPRTQDFPGTTPAMIASWTAEFLRRKVTYPVYSDEIQPLFAALGFAVSLSRHRDREGELGAIQEDGAWRVGVVAIKPSGDSQTNGSTGS